MFEAEKQIIDEKILAYCQQNGLPSIKLEWRNIPFSGQWGMAAPLFPLAAKEDRLPNSKPIPQRAQEIAQELADTIGLPPGFTRVQAVKGYLNLYFSTSKFAQRVVTQVISQGANYGNSPAGGKKTMVEYSQPNTHKSMHVGHLRNVILGGAVSNILEAAGDVVVRAFDPFPYGLLTMVVSLEAIFLSTFVLISQNRLSEETERRSDLDLHIGLLTEHELTRVLQMLDVIQDKMGIVDHKNSELADLEMETKPEDVLAEIHRLQAIELSKR